MDKKLFAMVLMSGLLSTTVFSQDLGGALGIGVRGGVAQYQGNDFDSKKIRAWGNLVGEPYLTNQFSLECALNLGQIAGETGSNSFRSTLTGLSLLGRLALVPGESIRPYVAAGAEFLGVDPKDDNQISQYDRRFLGVPFGGGVGFKVGENIALDIRGLYHHTFRDRLDGAELDRDDSFITGTAGLTIFYRASPLKADSDGDGLNDADEIKQHKTDANKADSDGDGLSDGEKVTKYKTEALKADSDGDGLNDGDEVKKTNTDAMKPDSDGDGLKDGDEVNLHKTNPLKADTDGGTVNDGAEVARGGNPNDAGDDIPPKPVLQVEIGKAIVLAGVVFQSGSSVISPQSEEVLTQAFNTLNDNPEIEVEIQGHTDNHGSRALNTKLSLARAKAVKAWLVSKGIAANRIQTQGFGPDQPIASNDTAEGRQQNRRIEFIRLK